MEIESTPRVHTRRASTIGSRSCEGKLRKTPKGDNSSYSSDRYFADDRRIHLPFGGLFDRPPPDGLPVDDGQPAGELPPPLP